MLRRLDMIWHRQFSHRRRIYLSSVLLIVPVIVLSVWIVQHSSRPSASTSTVGNQFSQPVKIGTVEDGPTPKAPTPAPTPNPTHSPVPLTPSPPFLFGVGPELDQALNYRITKEAPIKLLSSWYNGSKDLNFMTGWRSSIVPKAYASGYALHLIIYSNDAEQNLDTPYGAACGRPYPLSGQFLSDMQQLAQIFAGGKLYVSMFTEFQTYPCIDNTWASGENYYRAVKDQYLAAMDSFHKLAPGSQVSLSWGGWQTNWDDAGQGGGRSLFKHFSDVMNASDFQSFQMMSTTSNLGIIRDMVTALQPYNGGTMVAHYKPDDGNQSTFNSDMTDIFTPANMASLQQNGLFAFSFMDTNNMNSSEETYQSVKKNIESYAR